MIKLYILLFLMLFLYCSGCNDNIAGTISETDTGCSVAGVIRDSAGTVVSEATVILHDQRIPFPSVPAKRMAGKALQRYDTTATDQNGCFLFDSVGTGDFLIEVSYLASLGVIIPVTVDDSDTLIEKQGTLQLTGTIIGSLDSSVTGSPEDFHIFVQELGRIAAVDSFGNFSIGNLPVWEYHLSIIRDSLIIVLPDDTVPVMVSPGETSVISDLGPRTAVTVPDYSMVLNANGTAGAISFNVSDNVLSGDGVIGEDVFFLTRTDYNESNIWNGSSIPVFSFTTYPTNQEWFGWYSWSGTTAAGYYTELTSQVKRPWVAAIDRSDIPDEFSGAVREINGYYRFNANGNKGRLMFEGRVTGSGIVSESMTGGTVYHPFDCSLFVADTLEVIDQRPVYAVTFMRSDTLQQFFGWQSSDGNLIAGYYTDYSLTPAVDFPWFATRTADSSGMRMIFDGIPVSNGAGVVRGEAFLEENSSLLLRLQTGESEVDYQLDISIDTWVATEETDFTLIPVLTDSNSRLSGYQVYDSTFLEYRVVENISYLWYRINEDTSVFSGDIVMAGITENPPYNPVKIFGMFDVAVKRGGVITDYGRLTDPDGNVYRTVKIGNQEWMAENLRTTRYRDGTPLQYDTTANVYDSIPKYYYYKNTTDADTINMFGAYYNWYVVNPENPQRIASEGWHVPTDADWDALQNYLIAKGYNWDGTMTGNKIAKAMAAQTGWDTITGDSIEGAIGYDTGKNNSSGFSALPGGFRDIGGVNNIGGGNFTAWWSTTKEDTTAYFRFLSNEKEMLTRTNVQKSYGFSVRLVKD